MGTEVLLAVTPVAMSWRNLEALLKVALLGVSGGREHHLLLLLLLLNMVEVLTLGLLR